MKNLLHIVYFSLGKKMVCYTYDIATLDVGPLNEREYHIHIMEKHEDRLVIKWGYYDEESVEVVKNGKEVDLFQKEIEFDENGSWYDVLESLSFCWIEKEETNT